jgi:hypothetical protein
MPHSNEAATKQQQSSNGVGKQSKKAKQVFV